MGASVPYRVKVLRLIEDIVEVYAVTADEAESNAASEPNVARVISVVYDEEVEG